jgi:hypothetical protein
MKSFAYAYAIDTFHIKEKVNVFSVKDLARSFCDLKNGVKSQNKQSNIKWHDLKHCALN